MTIADLLMGGVRCSRKAGLESTLALSSAPPTAARVVASEPPPRAHALAWARAACASGARGRQNKRPRLASEAVKFSFKAAKAVCVSFR